MTGGGFGGAAIAVLQPDAFPALYRALEREYYIPAGMTPSTFLVRAVGGAAELAP
jgi:galactokinase